MAFDPKERHAYRRHGYGLLLTWYTWFTALNYGVLGWMIAQSASVQHPLICLMATVFIANNLFAIWVMYFVHQYYRSEFDDATDPAEKRISRMYVVGIYGMCFVYTLLTLTWVVVPFLWPDAAPVK